ncbi:MAG: Ig-like domain-containing protein [bacterium]|nr:Ig-like domain-containing protein [bacterium]
MKRLLPFIALLLLASVLGFSCGSDEKSTDPVDLGDTTAIRIDSAVPGPGDTGVSIYETFTVYFSEPFDTNTVHRGVMTVGLDSGDFHRSIDEISIKPLNRLTGGVVYQVRVSGSVTDTAGNSLGSDSVWTIQTTTSIAGPYKGAYTGILFFGTDAADTMVQPIDFFFGDATFKLNIDTTRPIDTLFKIGVGEGTFRYSPDTAFFKGAIWGPDIAAGFNQYDPDWDIVGPVESLTQFAQGDSVEFVIYNSIDKIRKRIRVGRIQ